ncbi:hypothetical protein LNKW23_09270 [Paralimibaculum aggregatum]|uniref:N-acetyltransferase domain-containing protein n=1 Tax=Paralimibaculum aggregatum TaxID=3036245 RepID=A0ABQ6LHV2_9RHOB|nr:nucleotidyltransferase family protein [Limibaculum sp. NKW23]GMG81714.1 hypothetical protein LNKW23_09270 [Limibaculum sp. NKW23]
MAAGRQTGGTPSEAAGDTPGDAAGGIARLRRLAPDDRAAPAVLALLRGAFAYMEGRIDPPSSLARLTAAGLGEMAARGTVLVAETAGTPLACLAAEPRGTAFCLSKIAVARQARGQGLARRLIEAAAAEARGRGLARLTLQSRVELTEAHAAFRALGFAETGRTAHPGFDRPTSISFARAPGAAPGAAAHAGATEAGLAAALSDVVAASPGLAAALEAGRRLALPQWRIVSGAVYNQVWNHLTGRPDLHGVRDIDLAYFDPDTRWEAEDAAIARARALFPETPPVEVRNQARVHLWYARRFGHPCPPLGSVEAGIARYASRAHCIGLRLEPDGKLDIHAPFGLADIFAMRLAPNPVAPNGPTHRAKAARQAALWPELTVLPWPDEGAP